MTDTTTVEPDSIRQEDEQEHINRRMNRIRHKIIVLSGKGGVGKSTVAANLAVSLERAGKKVGLLDVDIHGPSIPTMLGLNGTPLISNGKAFEPVFLGNLAVMSIGFLIHGEAEALIWRGPMKMGVIRQLLADVEWGDLDYMVIDCPPGTGDEPLSICQLIEHPDGAIVVTTPQQVAAIDVRKALTFCEKLSLPVLGIVENMSGFTCPGCGETVEIFPSGGGRKIAADFNVPFLGSLPIDPAVSTACDEGKPFVHFHQHTETAAKFRDIIAPILALTEKEQQLNQPKGNDNMKIAIPTANGKLSMHFGHCDIFTIMEVNPDDHSIIHTTRLEAPPHEPGLLPRWLAEQGATTIISGGMGQRAQSLFAANGIEVVVGAPAEEPEALARAYLTGSLTTGANICDH